MHTLKISLLVFILSITISAQWFVKPVSFDNLLNTVVLISPDTVFLAAGYPPGVLKTFDGGNNWIMDSLGSSNLEDMFFINSQIGWVVGADIFKTTDSGENWNIQPSGNHVMLLSIDFVSPNLGWSLEASGGKVLKTLDGGDNWFIVSENYLNTFGYFYDVDFISDMIGFAVSDNGIIMKTTDGGASWSQIFNNASLGFRRIKINQEGIGWTVGFNGTILHTTDNGLSWNIQNSLTSTPLWDISIVNENLAYIVGTDGTIFITSDGGQVWELQESPTSNALLSVCFIDENNGWAVGQNGTIIFTINGGVPLESSVSINNGWNILSVPLAANDMTGATLFPSAISPFYSYSSGYQQVTTLQNGNGYWAKFDGNQSVTISGTLVNTNEVSVTQGWNLIGPFNTNISVSVITTTPPNIIASPFFGYENGYTTPTELLPGKGYWIKTNASGTIHLNTILR